MASSSTQALLLILDGCREMLGQVRNWSRSLSAFRLMGCPVLLFVRPYFVERPDDRLLIQSTVIRSLYFWRYVSATFFQQVKIALSVLSAVPVGGYVGLRHRDWVPTFTGLLYRQALILVPPNHSMQRTFDSVLRLAAPSLGLRQRPLISTLGGVDSLFQVIGSLAPENRHSDSRNECQLSGRK